MKMVTLECITPPWVSQKVWKTHFQTLYGASWKTKVTTWGHTQWLQLSSTTTTSNVRLSRGPCRFVQILIMAQFPLNHRSWASAHPLVTTAYSLWTTHLNYSTSQSEDTAAWLKKTKIVYLAATIDIEVILKNCQIIYVKIYYHLAIRCLMAFLIYIKTVIKFKLWLN